MANWTEEDYKAYLSRRGKEKNASIHPQSVYRRSDKGARGRALSEHAEQVALFKACKAHEHLYPGLELIHAIPNGGQRHIAVARKLKAEGVKAGVPDIFLPVPRGNTHGLYIELKAIGGRVTDLQRKMMAGLAAQGYACRVCHGWESAWREIQNYLRGDTVLF